MQNNFPIKVMIALLAVLVVMGGALSWMYVRSTREARELSARAAAIQKDDLLVRSLVTDLVEYSKRNPDIIPLLQQHGIQLRPASTPAQPQRK